MTYKELLDALKAFTPDQLALDVSIYTDMDEYYGLKSIEYCAPDDCDVLDPGHPMLYTT